jgi:hypothetical protein
LGELVAEVSDKPRAPFASTGRDAFRRLWDEGYPDDLTDEVIAAYWQLHHRPRDAWSFEIDLRPWVEKF